MNKKTEINRIYHHYEMWEDWKFGFYDNVTGSKTNFFKSKCIEMFNDFELTKKYMDLVIEKWKFSCEHNLSNLSMNRIAYIGQAACCIYAGVPNLITMNCWSTLDLEVRNRSDIYAKKTILKWEQNLKLNNMLMNGRKKDMIKEYQTSLLLN